MKKTSVILTLCLFALFFVGCITAKYANKQYPNPFEFQKIDTVAGSQNDLFVKANEWVAKTFVDAKEVIQMHDKEAGKIIAKGVMASSSSMGAMVGTAHYYVSYTLAITVKDNRYKVTLSDYIVKNGTVSSPSGKLTYFDYNTSIDDKKPFNVYANAWENVKGDCYAQSKALIKSLKEQMRKEAEVF